MQTWKREYKEQVEGLLAHSLEIETPDEDLNRSLRWAELALDEAWVCNTALGCGEVAGYGPSRPGRRPQYDWFFAGDGLVATEALLHTGEYDRARTELRFIAGYQNPKNGMIWHELSQSGALLNWTGDYPYMYVHVDTTFQYLATMGDFLRITGDTNFVGGQWNGLKAAYAYCNSVISPATGLPQIPADQEGEDEQDRLRDELGLSAEWYEAARAYAALASAVNDAQAAADARRAADRAKSAIAEQYWDIHRSFWIAGHTMSGAAIEDDRVGPTELLSQGVFSAEQREAVLNRLTSPSFVTDWGERGMSADSPNYDPNAYSRGTVSLLGSTSLATGMWAAHRPVAAWELWRGLDQWNALDSAGHLHELLAGDHYHPEYESVPEQTWSSAGFITSAVTGLLGVEIDGAAHTVRFAPHLPIQWNAVMLRHLWVGNTELSLHVQRMPDGLTLDVDESGSPIALTFSPQLPLGAVVESATINGKPVSFSMEDHLQDEHVTVALPSIQGSSRCAIHYRGGIAIAVVRDAMHIGDGNSAPKVVSVQLQKNLFTLDIFVSAVTGGALELTTENSLRLVSPRSAARIVPEGKGEYRLLLSPLNTNVTDGYQYRRIQLSLGKTV
jgi:glycogen debranching enzyme